jgi:hypothetical protein
MEVKLLIENKFNEGFLRKVFNANKTGPITINRDREIGRFITSLSKWSCAPPKQTIGITLILPVINTRLDEKRFYYLTVEDQSKINDYINANFKNWLDRCLIEGIYKVGLNRKDVIDVIINELSLTLNSAEEQKIYERLAKWDYRKRMETRKILVKAMQSIEV